MGWSPERCECQEREDAHTQPLRWARGLLTDTVPPALPGLSLEPPGLSKRDPRETRSFGGQEVLPSLEAIKDQAPSRQGGVTQGAGRPSPADRNASVALCSALLSSCPIFRD